jgi:site-specific DNA-methyltransferase (adenine-specific)
MSNVLIGDCFDIIPTLPEKSFNLILTDPPYGLFDRGWDKKIRDWSVWWDLIENVSADNCSYIIFSAFPDCLDIIQPRKKWFKYELIYQKTKPTGFLNARRQPLRSHELILVFARNKITYNPQGLTKVNVHQSRRNKSANSLYNEVSSKEYTQKEGNFPKSVWGPYTKPSKCIHPAQKPIKLLKELILTYSNDGDNILDPFAGSGSTGKAADLAGRSCTLVEKDGKFVI